MSFHSDGRLLAEQSSGTVRQWDISEWIGEQAGTAVEQAMPHTLTIVSGDGQEGTVGEPLARPFVVSVLDQEGAALPGLRLRAYPQAMIRSAKTTGRRLIDNDLADEPQAWLMPDPAEVEFDADDPAWKTFTVHTTLDSVLVRANPSGSDPAIEVAGGRQVPSTDYCPAEGNDRPTRGRRDGWSLHVKACQAGRTKILLIDYDTGAVVQ